MANRTTGTFTASGQSTSIAGGPKSKRNVYVITLSLSGFGSATVDLQRSFDNGGTWKTVQSYSVDTEINLETVGYNVLYRLDCTWTSGTIAYVLGR